MLGDWDGFQVRAPLAHERVEAAAVGQTLDYFYGSSLDFLDALREHRPDLLAPERQIVPLDGQVGWDPTFEQPETAKCPGCLTAIEPRDPRPLALFGVSWDLDSDDRPIPVPEAHPVGCPYCRGRITPGSLLYCPKCYASGFELRLSLQRGLAGLPAAEHRTTPESTAPSRPPGVAQTEPRVNAPHTFSTRPPLTRKERRQQLQARSMPCDGSSVTSTPTPPSHS